jgi:hypothetical protein
MARSSGKRVSRLSKSAIAGPQPDTASFCIAASSSMPGMSAPWALRNGAAVAASVARLKSTVAV